VITIIIIIIIIIIITPDDTCKYMIIKINKYIKNL